MKDKAEKARKKLKVRKLRLQTKFNIMFTLFALVLGFVMYKFTQATVVGTAATLYWKRAQGAAYISANYLKTSFTSEIESMTRSSEDYDQMVQRLTVFKQALDVHDLIVYIPGTESAMVYIALQSDEPDPLEYGNIISYSEEDKESLLPAIQDGIASDEAAVSSNSHSGHSGKEISAWSAVKDAKGTVIAVVEADIDTAGLMETAFPYMLLMMVVYILIVLVGRGVQLAFTKRMVVHPLQKLTARVVDFVSDDQLMGFENDIKTGDEIQALNEALGQMSRNIADYAVRRARNAASEEQAAAERKIAARMQHGMEPSRPEDFLRKYDIWLDSRFVASPEVEGDSYDYFALDDSRMAVVLSSIGTTGLAAAVQLLVARTIIRSQLLSGRSFPKAVAEINRQLYEQLPQHDELLRVFVGVLDGRDHSLTYVNADSNAPILMRRGQPYSFLPCPAYAPMGQVENVSYQEHRVEFQQGDRLLWYSDGVLKMPDENGQPLDVEKLKKMLNDQRAATPEDLMAQLDALDESGSVPRAVVLLECRQVDRKRGRLRVEPSPENIGQVREFVRKQLEKQPLSARAQAQMQVCAEEYFSLCCRYVKQGMVELSCVSEEKKFTLRFTADMNGLDPFRYDAGETMENTMGFIRKYTDEASSRVVGGCTVVTMSRELMEPSMEE